MATDEKRTLKVDVGEHGLKQHDLRVWTVVFMVFSLVAAGAYGIEEMIRLIDAQRSFEAGQKVIQAQDELNGKAVNEIGRV